MGTLRHGGCLALAIVLASTPAYAQQPLRDSVTRAVAASVSEADAHAQAGPRDRRTFLGGAILTVAGGTAIILGMTVLKTANATSGNTPEGAYDACVALKASPVYRANDCEVLKGPNKAVVIGGAIATAAGAALMMRGSANSSVTFGLGGVRLRHRVTF